MSVTVEKQAPVGGDRDVWPELQKFMEERVEMGMERYGVPLQTHNGIPPIKQAMEELFDLLMYLMQERMERECVPEMPDPDRDLRLVARKLGDSYV